MPPRQQLTRREDGRFMRSLTYTDQATGKKKRLPVYGKTQREVNENLRQARARLDADQPVRDASRTLSEWLAQWLLTSLRASDRAASTKDLYQTLLRVHVVPQLGATRLDRLRASDITRLIATMQEAHLSPSTVRSTYAALRAAMDDAVTEDLLAANPVTKVKRPRAVKTEAACLNRAEVAALLDATASSRYGAVLQLILGTGLRRGEALAVKWPNLDLDRGQLRVRGSLVRAKSGLVVSGTKTDSSWRTVTRSDKTVALLRSQRASQAAERLRAANVWLESGFVFTTATGTPVDPRNVLRLVQAAAKASDMGAIGVHTLRHTYATAALLNGVPIHIVSRNLGHASVAITADIYGHVTDDASRRASETVSQALGL